jgi:hypothetical protein
MKEANEIEVHRTISRLNLLFSFYIPISSAIPLGPYPNPSSSFFAQCIRAPASKKPARSKP